MGDVIQVIEEIRPGDAMFVDALGRACICDRDEAARRAAEKGLAVFQPVFANRVSWENPSSPLADLEKLQAELDKLPRHDWQSVPGSVVVEPDRLKLRVGTLTVDVDANGMGRIDLDAISTPVRSMEISIRPGSVRVVMEPSIRDKATVAKGDGADPAVTAAADGPLVGPQTFDEFVRLGYVEPNGKLTEKGQLAGHALAHGRMHTWET